MLTWLMCVDCQSRVSRRPKWKDLHPTLGTEYGRSKGVTEQKKLKLHPIIFRKVAKTVENMQ